jgi:hypothetical protein
VLRRLSFGLAVVVAMAIAAAPVSAHQRHAPSWPILRVSGTHGWKIDIWTSSPTKRDGPEAVIAIWKRHAETAYRAPARVGPRGFSADFDRFGWIDVHYRPGPERRFKGCYGRAFKASTGRFIGAFVFHGEWHFTVADYPTLDVPSLPPNAEGCQGASSGGAKGATLEAVSRWAVTRVVQNRLGGRVRFMARAENEIGPVKIGRFIEAFGPAKDFVWSPEFRSARIAPPAPFHGTASFSSARRRDNWRGDLTVHFPGFRVYPLAFRPTLAFLEPGDCKAHGPRRPHPPGICD